MRKDNDMDKTCDKCGQFTNIRYRIDGEELCERCFKDWMMEAPKDTLDTILSNVDASEAAYWLCVDVVKDYGLVGGWD